MKNYYVVLCFLTLGFLFTEINAQQSYTVKRGERPPFDLQALPVDAYEKGILKIKLDESFTRQMDNNPVTLDENGTVRFNIIDIDQLNQQYGAKNFKKLFESKAFSLDFSERHRAWGFHLWYTLYFDEKTDIKELVNAYEQLPEVSITEPEYKKELVASNPITFQTKIKGDDPGSPPVDWTPNDPYYNQQWHYHNTGQQSGTPDADIDLPEAWDIERGNSNVIVCIEDGGIQYNHSDLSGNMWTGLGWDFVNDDASIEPHDHGTHVAGTVAAESNNGIGVSGVAGGSGTNDGVRLMSCQVFTNSSSGGFHLAPIYAANNGACISQNSWTYTSPNSYDQVVLDAIDYFNANGGGSAMLNGGITIFAAANYNSSDHYYPAYYSGTFSVAGTNNQDIKSWYSNYGTWVDISAPGGETNSVTARGVYSTITGNSYDFYQGTSMACPHTSGVAALIVSLDYGNLTPTDVADIIRNTTDNHYTVNPGYIGQLGTGRLNAYQALLLTQGVLTANFSGTPTSVNVGNTVTFTDASFGPNTITSYNWSFPGGTPSSANTAGPHTITYNTLGTYNVSLTVGDGTDTDTETKTDYINVVNCTYCTTFYSNTSDDWISNVTFNTINNNSGSTSYSDFTYISTDVTPGNSYTISVDITVDGPWVQHCWAWIDWNGDCDFDYAGEAFDLGQTPGTTGIHTLSTNVNVPAGATSGVTRMRISESYSTNPTPCISSVYGEAEDYTVNVIGHITLDLKAILEGPFNGTNMDANIVPYLPLSQPFNIPPWNYTGTESVGSIPNANVVDWVLIDVRDAASAGTATGGTSIAKQAAFILNDGSIVGLDGSSNLQFDGSISQNLFVVVWQRNHLGIMSNDPLTPSGGLYSYDFTSGINQVFGGIDGHKQISIGIWGMIGGDGNHDGQVDSNDKSPLWEGQAGEKGYLFGDHNLDGESNNQDKDDIWVPNEGKVSQVPN